MAANNICIIWCMFYFYFVCVCVRFVNKVLLFKISLIFFFQNYTQLHEEILLKKSQIKDFLYMCSTNDTIKESEEESQLVILN